MIATIVGFSIMKSKQDVEVFRDIIEMIQIEYRTLADPEHCVIYYKKAKKKKWMTTKRLR